MFQGYPSCTPPIVRTLSLLAALVVIVMIIGVQTLSPIASAKIDDNAPAESAEFSDTGNSAEAKAPPKKIVGTPAPNGEVLEPDPPNRYFDDGRPDLLSGRETAFERWTEENPDTWDLLDSQLRDCVYTYYVNAFGNSPETGIDWCLAQAERADAEEIAAD